MHVCNKSSRGDQTLLNGLKDCPCSLTFSVETRDEQQASSIFEISAKYARPVL